MALKSNLRQLAGEAALQMIMEGEARATASVRSSGRPTGPPRQLRTGPKSDAQQASIDSTAVLLRAADRIVHLAAHSRELEAYARDREAWAAGEIERLETEMRRWEKVGADIDRETREVGSRVALMERRIASAEASAEEHRAALAKLTEQLATAFGSGSRVCKAMAELGFCERM